MKCFKPGDLAVYPNYGVEKLYLSSTGRWVSQKSNVMS